MRQTTTHFGTQLMRTIFITLSILTLWPLNAAADVTIHPGATVTMGGGAKVSVSGDWTNNGTFNAGDGTVIFNGTTTQTVTDTNGDVFNNLTVNKSSGTLILNSHLFVNSTLTMTDGNIDTNGFVLTLGIFDEGTLTHTDGFIIGGFERYINATTGIRDFPVGTGSQSRKVTIDYTAAPAFPGGTLKVSHVDAGTNFVKLTPELDDNGVYAVDQRSQMYWGLFPSGLSGGTYKLSVTADGQNQIINNNALRLIRSDDGVNFNLAGLGAHVAATGATAKRSGITVSFPWFAYVGQGYATPGNAPPLIPAAGSFGPTTIYEGETDTGFFAYTYEPENEDVTFEFQGGWWSGIESISVETDDDGLTELAEFYPFEAAPMLPAGVSSQTFAIQVRAIDTQSNASSWSAPIVVNVIDQDAGERVDVSLTDNGFEEITLFFNFPFYDRTPDNKVFINANGNLTFGTASTGGDETVQKFLGGPARIAGWWDDLDPSGLVPPEGVSYTNYTDKTVISFSKVPQVAGGDANSFSITLHSSGKIELSGYDMDATDGIVGISPGFTGNGTAVTLTRDSGSYTDAIYEEFGGETLPPSTIITFTPNGTDSYYLNSDNARVSFAMGYDELDNPAFLRRTDAAGNVDRTLTVDYDDLSRVIKVDYEDSTSLEETTTFDYDEVGNRSVMAVTGQTAVTYNYAGDANQLTNRSQAPDHAQGYSGLLFYFYDAEGNLDRKTSDAAGMSNDHRHQFTYDAAGRLKKVEVRDGSGTLSETVQYFYDGDGNRVKIIDNSGTRYFLYSGSRKLLELDASQTVTAYYVHGADGIVYRKKTTGAEEYEYHHKDWLGGTTLITDDNQDVAASYFYNVFGDLRWSFVPSGTDNEHLFTGKEFDDSTNLYYFWRRYYDAYVGRFTQRDPAFDGINWYIYVENNPLRYVDPTGEGAVGRFIGTVLGIGVGGVSGAVTFGGAGAVTGSVVLGPGTVIGFTIGAFEGAMIVGTAGGVVGGQVGSNIEDAITDIFVAKDTKAKDGKKTPADKRKENIEKGIPESRLGPSGEPKIHVKDHSTPKKAKDAARKEGDSKTVHHPSPKKGKPHFHPADKTGKKISPSTHHTHPKRR